MIGRMVPVSVKVALVACMALAGIAGAAGDDDRKDDWNDARNDDRADTAALRGIQGHSLFGDPLISPPPDRETVDKLTAARMEYELDSADPDNIIWYGRRLAYAGDFRAAIRIFSEGIGRHPQDARMYRHRGHRYISVREFDRAIEDLEHAANLIEGSQDRIEPDGLPNALNIPVSTLHGNIWYHLGLAWYLKQDWLNAYRAFQAGFETGANDDNVVSTTHWRYMILRRMGKMDEAKNVLADIAKDMNVLENTVYHRLCLFYDGKLSLEEITAEVADSPTGTAAAYGVANWFFYNGDRAEADRRLREILRSDQWASFGYMAAEADLASRREDPSLPSR